MRDLASQFRRRAGRAASLADEPHRDAIEKLRRRAVGAADGLLDSYEDELRRRPGKAEPERLRQIVRVIREAAALPAREDPDVRELVQRAIPESRDRDHPSRFR